MFIELTKTVENWKLEVRELHHMVTYKEDEGVQCHPVDGHSSRDSEESTTDKSAVLSEEDNTQDMTAKDYNDLVMSASKVIGRLDGDYLEKLYINLLEGSFVYNMKDFYSLVVQLYMVQEAYKRKK